MRNYKKLFTAILAVAVCLCLCVALGACNKEGTSVATGNGEMATYTVTVKSAGGLPLEKVAVSVYADGSLSDLKGYDETDEKGVATIELENGINYAITLSGCPKGYELKDSYSFSGTKAEIVLTSSVVQGENLGDTTLGLGDIMYDFTVTTPDGTKVVLSELLKEKKMVLLNFWYTSCSWCVTEFPFMEEAYQLYKDDVAIVAVDPLGESDDAIKAFPANYNLELTFPLAGCPTTWANTFGITGYPTSVIIDRYGMITLIEAGAITSLRPFTGLFETMTADDYTQKLYGSVGELVTNVKPTFEMDTSENVAALVNSGDIQVTYRPESDESAEYAWPFIAAEKNGEKCLKASNQKIESSFAIMYADVTLKAGQAFGFDFLRSTEAASDVMYVIVNGDDVNAISGAPDPEKWESCYPVVALEDGTYEVALCYMKDEATDVGDDTIYLKNMRVIDAKNIDTATYIPRQAATSVDGFAYNYETIVYNAKDGYYHVGTENGPLLLADLMGYTQFSEESTVWEMAYNGKVVLDGKNYAEELEQYCNYASNSNLINICTVNQELYELLQVVDKVMGFDDADDKEWLKLCKYYQAYGTDGAQLEDPIAGLAPFSAYTAKLGKNVKTNYFYYNRIIMPRGMLARFTPSKSGVYRITSRSESQNGVDGWIFDENHQELLTYEQDERLFNDSSEVSMVYYMEKGKSYYIDIAFWDPYEVGYIYYDVEFIKAEYEHFRLCSPGPFTYDSDATGDAMYHVIHGGVKAVLGSDGYYRVDLGNGKQGSKIYADFVGITSLFNTPIATVGGVKGMIDKGGFDFSKDENDQYVLTVMAENDNDQAKTDAALKELWGEDFEANYEIYKVEDVYAGKYHGKGQDYTQQIKAYLSKMIKDGHKEREGCVLVDQQLAEILQMLMDKFTFENVDQGWLKLCYYYDYLGPGRAGG